MIPTPAGKFALALTAILSVGGCATSVQHWAKVTPITEGQQTSATDAYYLAASSAIYRRDYAEALELLQLARDHQPNDVRVLNAFGVVYDKLGRFDLSARYYSQAKKLDPNSTIIGNNLAYSQRLQGQQYGAAGPVETAEATAAPRGGLQMAPYREATAAARTTLHMVAPRETTAMPRATVHLVAAREATPAPGAALHEAAALEASAMSPRGTLHIAAAAKVKAASGGALLMAASQEAPAARPRALLQPVAAHEATGVFPATLHRLGFQPAIVRLGAPTMRLKPLPMLAGAPLMVINASGRNGGAEAIRAQLANLGWSARKVAPAATSRRAETTITYPAAQTNIARALARTLPGPVRMVSCSANCGSINLAVGADVTKWKLARRSSTDGHRRA